MNRHSLLLIGAVWLGLSLSTSAHAIAIQYDITSLGSSNYRYDYTVTNDGSLGSGFPVSLFDIYFDPALYLESSLSIATPGLLASSWDQSILSSGLLIPAAYDAYALNGGIADGSFASGFAVEFTWLGLGALPGSQAFDVYDPTSFAVLESGSTTALAIPAPDTLALIGIGAVALLWTRRRKRLPERGSVKIAAV